MNSRGSPRGSWSKKFNQRGDFAKSRPTTVFHLALPQKNLFARDRWLGKSWELRLSIFPILHVANQSVGNRFQKAWLAVRDCGNPMQKLFRARMVATSSTRLTQTTHNTTSKNNGLHCLLLHRLRRGPQGDQDPGAHLPSVTRFPAVRSGRR